MLPFTPPSPSTVALNYSRSQLTICPASEFVCLWAGGKVVFSVCNEPLSVPSALCLLTLTHPPPTIFPRISLHGPEWEKAWKWGCLLLYHSLWVSVQTRQKHMCAMYNSVYLPFHILVKTPARPSTSLIAHLDKNDKLWIFNFYLYLCQPIGGWSQSISRYCGLLVLFGSTKKVVFYRLYTKRIQ